MPPPPCHAARETTAIADHRHDRHHDHCHASPITPSLWLFSFEPEDYGDYDDYEDEGEGRGEEYEEEEPQKPTKEELEYLELRPNLKESIRRK
ncbi:hypothetical protein RIF29_26205 [Crotalaria pallida]|uniref:Uncharacterized protein n=1 Tax=Crotalaria pallida TaxID=3830 RepID=A0AAN9EME0_CROPI